MRILPTKAVRKAKAEKRKGKYSARVIGPGVITLDPNEVFTKDNAVLARQLDQLKRLKARSSPIKK